MPSHGRYMCNHHIGPNKYVMLYQRFTAFYAPVVNVVQVGMYWNFTTSREKGLMENNEEKGILLMLQVKN